MDQNHVRTKFQNNEQREYDHLQERAQQLRFNHQRMQKLTERTNLSLQERRGHLGYGKSGQDIFTDSVIWSDGQIQKLSAMQTRHGVRNIMQGDLAAAPR